MKPTGARLFLFRFVLLIIVVILLEMLSYTLMWFNSRHFDFASDKNYLNVRAMLIGNTNAEQFPRYLTLPYMGYIPYPGYIKDGIIQHNTSGYRGSLVPQLKTNKYRVLCLGGSTTYGFAVPFPQQAYPAQLQLLLNQQILEDSILSKKYSGAEVINAGLEAGTSAEELQQYLFKYRYYQPDAVIVHSGVNDAELVYGSTKGFQLDYTHHRRLQFHLEPLPQPARWLMHSYFISYCAIRLFYQNFYDHGPSGRNCYTLQQGQTYCRWTDVNIDTVIQNQQHQYLPFYRNTQSLFSEIIRDSAALLVIPNVLNPRDTFVQQNPKYMSLVGLNQTISETLAQQVGAVAIPFAYHLVPNPAWWVDDCHVNAAGEKFKAAYIAPYVLQAARRQALSK